MRTVESTGKSVEEAKKKAARELGVSEQDIEFEVLEVGAKGLFGLLGGAPARVRATYYEPRRPVSDRSGSRDDYQSGGRSGGRSGGGRDNRGTRSRRPDQQADYRGGRRDNRPDQNAPAPSQEGVVERLGPGEHPARLTGQGRSKRRGQRPEPQSNRRPNRIETAQQPATPAQPDGQDRSQNRRPPREDSRRLRGQANGRMSPYSNYQQPPTEAREPQTVNNINQSLDLQGVAGEAVKLVQDILNAGQIGATARISEIAADGVEIEIEGGDSLVLVGKQGQTLDALQFLSGIMINRQRDTKVRLTLEAAGYRRKHRETLEKTARELAEQVVEHAQEAELEPLPARDRRIIHNALKDHPGVLTYSEGEGENRRVVISPKQAQEEAGEPPQ